MQMSMHMSVRMSTYRHTPKVNTCFYTHAYTLSIHMCRTVSIGVILLSVYTHADKHVYTHTHARTCAHARTHLRTHLHCVYIDAHVYSMSIHTSIPCLCTRLFHVYTHIYSMSMHTSILCYVYTHVYSMFIPYLYSCVCTCPCMCLYTCLYIAHTHLLRFQPAFCRNHPIVMQSVITGDLTGDKKRHCSAINSDGVPTFLNLIQSSFLIDPEASCDSLHACFCKCL